MKIYFVSCPFLSVHQKVTWPCAFVNFSDLKVDLKIKGYCIESIENVQQWNFANAYHASDKLFYYTKPLSNQKSKIHWKSIARELVYLYVTVYVRLSVCEKISNFLRIKLENLMAQLLNVLNLRVLQHRLNFFPFMFANQSLLQIGSHSIKTFVDFDHVITLHPLVIRVKSFQKHSIKTLK